MDSFVCRVKSFALWVLVIFLGYIPAVIIGGVILAIGYECGIVDKENQEVALVVMFGSYALILWGYWRWTTRYRGKFRKIQKDYEKARKTSIANPNLSFNSLPVFPVKAPYEPDKEQRSRQLAASTTGSLDMIMNHYLGKIRSVMPELLYMRGDNHEAWGSNSRVLLMIEEVEQAKRELAIVALVVQKRGTMCNFSIRRSCWPTTLHNDAPRSYATKKISGFKSDTYYNKSFYTFFAPIEWEVSNVSSRGGYTLQPCFHAETEEAAEAIASGVLACLSDEM